MDLEKIVDFEGAMARMGGDRDLFEELVQFFLEDTPGLMAQVSAGIRDNDAESLELAAHSVKGLLSNFGAERAGKAAFRLEQNARSHNLTGAAEIARELEEEIARLKEALAPYCRGSADAGGHS